jgi:SAM-dependent methyltransferase
LGQLHTDQTKVRVTPSAPRRICPRCGAGELIEDAQQVWPVAWSCRACAHSTAERDGIPLLSPELADSASGMDITLFEPLAHWEDGNFWFVPRNRLVTALLGRYFPDAECFMEVGCGNGFVLSAIASMKPWRRLVASELHPAGLATARARLDGRAEFVQMDARFIPAAEALDVIGAFDVLEHIEDDTAVLASMHRALRDGGGILLSVPQHSWLWSATDVVACHVRRYSRGELEAKVRAAGFHVLFSGSYTTLLLPLMLASRKSGASEADSLRRQFELPHAANSVLKSVLQLEVMLTLAGVRFPVGGSRLVVAAKNGAAAPSPRPSTS